MRIEFWLDFLCPITYLMHKNLTEAIKELGLQKYEFYYRSFQIKEETFNENLIDVFFEHHCNQDKEKLEEFLKVNFPKYTEMNFYDTNLAHQLAHLSKHKNLAQECNTEIFKAYFEKDLDISDKNVLLDVAKNIGLDLDETNFTLNTKCYSNQILINKENANNRGITELPHLRVNIKYNQNGYLTKNEIKDLLVNIINNKGSKVEVCGEYCEF